MKVFIAFCFRRPITVTAFYILMAVLAVLAYSRLPIALLPELRYPAVTVWTAYPDVSPDRVERAVTEPLEEALAGTQGLRHMTSRSLLGGSLIRLDFGWNTNMDLTLLEVREQIDRLGTVLPDKASSPIVLQLDPSERPILLIALSKASSDRSVTMPVVAGSQIAGRSPTDLGIQQDILNLKEVGREIIARRLEQLDDVSRVRVSGGFERRIEVVVNPDQLATYGVGIEHIGKALSTTNIALAGGTIRRGPFRYAVEVSGEFKHIDDIANTMIGQQIGAPVLLRDVAEVREGIEEPRGLVRLDGSETILLSVERRPDANTVKAAEEVRAKLGQLAEELPGVRLDIVIDESRFIKQAIGGVAQAIFLGGFLAIIVLFLFLRHPHAMLAVASSIPLSLAITLVLFDAFDVSFNLISLSGLALGIGMLVDNAIVVVENIARLREQGQTPWEAAHNGVAEVSGAITASTLTTIAVFFPLTFVEGLSGQLFRDQSLAVICSLLASLLVALTAVPLLASRSPLVSTSVEHKDVRSMAGWLLYSYEKMLTWCLSHPRLLMVGYATLLVHIGLLGWNLPREVIPEVDQGHVEIHLTLPPEADLSLISSRSARLENWFQKNGLARHVMADLGERDEARLDLEPRPSYQGDLRLILSSTATYDDVLTEITTLTIPDDTDIEVKAVKTQLEALLSDEADLFIDLVSEQRDKAEIVLDNLLRALKARPELTNVRRADPHKIPTYQLEFRRENMKRFGVESGTINAYLEAAARGLHATELRTVNEETPIIIRSSDINSLQELLDERLPARNGLMPIGLFVVPELVHLPSALIRSEQAPIIRLTADISPGADLALATLAAEQTLDMHLTSGIQGQVSGSTETFRASMRAVGWSLLLSLLIVYLILAAQFESLVQPLIVLASVPLAAAGVAIALWLTGQTVNLLSLTGCVVLVGIVVNDAIVKVDFINQRRREGMPLYEAVITAGHDRVRPILMTTITTVLGLLPLAFSIGEGSELHTPLAIAIVGGLMSATVLILFFVPTLYLFVNRLSKTYHHATESSSPQRSTISE